MRDRGSALLTAVVAVMVLLLISGIFFSFVKNQFKMQTTEEKALKAYYLADAGTNYGIAYLIDSVKKKGEVNNIEEIEPIPLTLVLKPFGSGYGGDFEYTVSITNRYQIENQGNPKWVYYCTATGYGYYPGKDDVNRILRVIKKDYAFTTDITP